MAKLLPTQMKESQGAPQRVTTDKPPLEPHAVQYFSYIGQKEPDLGPAAYSSMGLPSPSSARGGGGFCLLCGWMVCGLLTLAVVVLSSILVVRLLNNTGGDLDSHGCRLDEGYRFCASLNGCIRPWEQGWTSEQAESKCHKQPGTADHHGCDGSAGYQWCAKQHRCMRPWKHGLRSNEAFAETCSVAPPKPVGPVGPQKIYVPPCEVDDGFQWCALAHKCVRPWEMNIKTNADFAHTCKLPGPLPQGDEDVHGCKPSAGFRWCNGIGRCVRTWVAGINSKDVFMDKCHGHPAAPAAAVHKCPAENGFIWCEKFGHCFQPYQHGVKALGDFFNLCGKAPVVVKDEHGCVTSASEQYCPKEKKCIQLWKTAVKTDADFYGMCKA